LLAELTFPEFHEQGIVACEPIPHLGGDQVMRARVGVAVVRDHEAPVVARGHSQPVYRRRRWDRIETGNGGARRQA